MAGGDRDALAELFARYRDKLWRMARFRLDPRLSQRIDADDVLQEAWVAAAKRLRHFDPDGGRGVFLWLREIVGQTMVDLYRRHVGADKRSAAREVPLMNGVPMVSSECLSVHLLASQTSPSQAAVRGESASRLAQALDDLGPLDREILTLRHFEELGNDDVAAILGLRKTAASNRYVRALKRLQRVFESTPPPEAPR